MMPIRLAVLVSLLLSAGCGLHTAIARGGPYSTSCIIADGRSCISSSEDYYRVYPGVTPQQALNATQQVWIDQGYDVRAAVLTQKPSSRTNADGTPLGMMYSYGDAERYFARGQGMANEDDCFSQRVHVGISQDNAVAGSTTGQQVGVHWIAKVKKCNGTPYGYGDQTSQASIDYYKQQQGFVSTQKSPRYARDFHSRLAKKLGVVGLAE